MLLFKNIASKILRLVDGIACLTLVFFAYLVAWGIMRLVFGPVSTAIAAILKAIPKDLRLAWTEPLNRQATIATLLAVGWLMLRRNRPKKQPDA